MYLSFRDISLASLHHFSIVFSVNIPTVSDISPPLILLCIHASSQTEMSATVLIYIDYGISIRTVGIN